MPVKDFFLPGGPLSAGMTGFEDRPEQVRMAVEVERALAEKDTLLVEAGTGVGKSFSYLVPAVNWTNSTGERLVISTHTITLQEQLIGKDIPFLQSLGLSFPAVLAKGRGNYICLRRLLAATSRAGRYLDFLRPEDFPFLSRIEDWFYKTGDGTLSTLDFEVPPRVWGNVRVERDACPGRKCRYYDGCPYFRDRKRWEDAQILIVNHALFFSDLALRMGDSPLLPGYGAVVFDEAHNIEEVATNHIGISLSKSEVLGTVRKVFDERSGKGFFSADRLGGVQHGAQVYGAAVEGFFKRLGDFCGDSARRVYEPTDFIDQTASVAESLVSEMSAAIAEMPEDSDERTDSGALASRVKETGVAISVFQSFSAEGFVYWVEGPQDNPTMHVTPISVAEHLKKHLWSTEMPHILTSATLATSKTAGCAYIRGRIGLDDGCRELVLGSPFDYGKLVKLFIPRDAPDPSANAEEYRKKLVQYIERLVEVSGGRAFVLFTNLGDMKYCHGELVSKLQAKGLLVLVQDAGMPRAKMLEAFAQDGRAVLFGVSSFWQGVDVRGAALSNVIIVRLPFEVPDHPVVEARRQEIQKEGRSDFREYTLPNAIIRLKQGFGRLVRTRTDSGIVAILDARIVSKSYGRDFLSALPPCPIVKDIAGLPKASTPPANPEN
ncbi:MAG: ATP-dependent DNA helicase [Candidatus Brocadiia bacterium]